MMTTADLDVVTGATSYTGRYIARALLARGRRVRGLARRWDTRVFGPQIDWRPLDFADPAGLVAGLQGAHTLYNTYWIRFPRHGVSFEMAIQNTRRLVDAAVRAGVRRIVHLSVSNAAMTSPLPYFRGKAATEEIICSCGLSYAIIRPTLIFGREEILLNNIAWLLRHVPIFLLPGDGGYRCQPVYVGDVAALAVQAGVRAENVLQDAAGPDIMTFADLVALLRRTVHSRATILRVPPAVALGAVRVLTPVLHDELLRTDELAALMQELLVSHGPATGTAHLATWLAGAGRDIGVTYHSERRRHWRGAAS